MSHGHGGNGDGDGDGPDGDSLYYRATLYSAYAIAR